MANQKETIRSVWGSTVLVVHVHVAHMWLKPEKEQFQYWISYYWGGSLYKTSFQVGMNL